MNRFFFFTFPFVFKNFYDKYKNFQRLNKKLKKRISHRFFIKLFKHRLKSFRKKKKIFFFKRFKHYKNFLKKIKKKSFKLSLALNPFYKTHPKYASEFKNSFFLTSVFFNNTKNSFLENNYSKPGKIQSLFFIQKNDSDFNLIEASSRNIFFNSYSNNDLRWFKKVFIKNTLFSSKKKFYDFSNFFFFLRKKKSRLFFKFLYFFRSWKKKRSIFLFKTFPKIFPSFFRKLIIIIFFFFLEY